MRWWLLLILLVPSAGAHASAVSTDPAHMTGLSEAPDYVSIRYSEPLDFDSSSIGIFDEKLLRRDAGDAFVDPEDPTVVKVYTGNLIRGIYTVSFEMRSAKDGHLERGSIPLTIGVPCSTCLEAVEARSAYEPGATPWAEVAALGAGYLGLTLVVGALVVVLLSRSGPRLENVLLAGAAIAIVGTFLRARQTWDYTDAAAHGGFLLRTGALVALLFFWAVRHRTRAAVPMAAASAAVLMLSWPLAGHGARSPGDWALQAVHVAAILPWAGGLVAMGIAWPTMDDRQATLRRFSRLATWTVGGLLATGSVAAAARLKTLDDLWLSAYGQWVLVKAGLAAAALAIGATNHLRVRARGPMRIRRSVAAEAGLVVAVLMATSVLALQSIPADRPDLPGSYQDTAWWGDHHLRLDIYPALPDGSLQVGDHRHSVRITDAEGHPVTGARVTFVFKHQILDIGVITQPATERSDGWYEASGSFLGGIGTWEKKVTWQPPGASRVYWGVFQIDMGDLGHYHGGTKVSDPHFDTGYMDGGAAYERHFAARDEGYFLYHCHPHQWMVASVLVDPNATRVPGDAVTVRIFGNASEPQGRMYFEPAAVVVPPGTTVRWVNAGDIPHSATNVRWYALEDPERPDLTGAA